MKILSFEFYCTCPLLGPTNQGDWGCEGVKSVQTRPKTHQDSTGKENDKVKRFKWDQTGSHDNSLHKTEQKGHVWLHEKPLSI